MRMWTNQLFMYKVTVQRTQPGPLKITLLWKCSRFWLVYKLPKPDSFVVNMTCDWLINVGGPGWVRCPVRCPLSVQKARVRGRDSKQPGRQRQRGIHKTNCLHTSKNDKICGWAHACDITIWKVLQARGARDSDFTFLYPNVKRNEME